jgi:hypothetical protein
MRLTTEDTEGTEKKRLLVQLVAGLLASGHYTEIATHEEYASGHPITEPRLKCYDHVLDDAESLLRDIEFYVRKESENE